VALCSLRNEGGKKRLKSETLLESFNSLKKNKKDGGQVKLKRRPPWREGVCGSCDKIKSEFQLSTEGRKMVCGKTSDVAKGLGLSIGNSHKIFLKILAQKIWGEHHSGIRGYTRDRDAKGGEETLGLKSKLAPS